MAWTENDIRKLHQDGKIKGYRIAGKPKIISTNGSRNIPRKTGNNIPAISKRSKEKEWLSWNLAFWANENALTLETEYRFDEKRKWRFDWALPGILVAIEYDGLFKGRGKHQGKTGHTSITGVLQDIEKQNAATLAGWKILRVSAKDYTSIIQKLNKIRK